MKYSYKLSKKMITDLQRGRAIELSDSGANICGIDDFKDTLPKLYELRLVDIKMVTVDEKERLCVSITKSGIAFLEGYEEDRKKLENRNKHRVRNRLIKEIIGLLLFILYRKRAKARQMKTRLVE